MTSSGCRRNRPTPIPALQPVIKIELVVCTIRRAFPATMNTQRNANIDAPTAIESSFASAHVNCQQFFLRVRSWMTLSLVSQPPAWPALAHARVGYDFLLFGYQSSDTADLSSQSDRTNYRVSERVTLADATAVGLGLVRYRQLCRLMMMMVGGSGGWSSRASEGNVSAGNDSFRLSEVRSTYSCHRHLALYTFENSRERHSNKTH